MNVRNNTEKSNVKPNRTDSRDGPLLGTVHRLSDDEEEIDVRIDENTDDLKDQGQLIYYEQDSEETDIDGRNTEESQAEPYLDGQSSRMASSASLNNAANFNYSAKQSVVWAELYDRHIYFADAISFYPQAQSCATNP